MITETDEQVRAHWLRAIRLALEKDQEKGLVDAGVNSSCVLPFYLVQEKVQNLVGPAEVVDNVYRVIGFDFDDPWLDPVERTCKNDNCLNIDHFDSEDFDSDHN